MVVLLFGEYDDEGMSIHGYPVRSRMDMLDVVVEAEYDEFGNPTRDGYVGRSFDTDEVDEDGRGSASDDSPFCGRMDILGQAQRLMVSDSGDNARGHGFQSISSI
jgi:hypothetical protein